MDKMPKETSELIEILKSKNIVFKSISEERRAEKFINKYNYSSIVSLKYLFSTGISTGNKLVYSNKVNYSDIEKKYLELLKFENKIRESVLEYEVELKINLTNFIFDFLQNEKIDFNKFVDCLYSSEKDEANKYEYRLAVDFKKRLTRTWDKNIKEYSPNYRGWQDCYYLLIKILSLGTISKFLDYVYQNQNTKINFKIYEKFSVYLKSNKLKFSIGNSYKELKGIVILRNALCHKESLVTFLDKGYREDLKRNSSNFLKSRKNAINIIYCYRFKNQKRLNSDSWIMSFETYRLNQTKLRNLRKIKLNL